MTRSQPAPKRRLGQLCSLLCIASLGLDAASVRAAPNDPAEHWLFVPVFAGQLPEHVSVEHFGNAFEHAFRSDDRRVLANHAAAGLFEARHSAEPVRLDSDEMTRLLRSVGEAARHLALGELPQAQQAMEGVYALSGPARDYLNREAVRARKIFDTCLMTAYLWERDHKRPQALHQMLECSRSFPGFRPEGRAYPPELREVFELAKQQLNQLPPTTLLVNSPRSCGVRLNGIELGKSPMSFKDVRSGITRVQLECEPGAAGRIHAIELKAGENRLDIDPAFDAAVHSQGALWLSYADDAQRKQRLDADAASLAKLLGVTRLVTLLVDGSINPQVTVRVQWGTPHDVDSLPFDTTSGYGSTAVSVVVRSLQSAVGLQPSVTEDAHTPAPVELDPPPIAAEPAHRAPAPGPATPTDQQLLPGVVLGTLGAGGMVTGWALYALRQDIRRRPLGGTPELDAFAHFRARGAVLLAVGSAGALVFALSEYFWLPDRRAIPAWAWVVGGLGTATGLTGLGFALFGTHCGPRLDQTLFPSTCSRFTADATFGPLLAMHALPLLGVPLAYALRGLLRPSGVDISLQVEAAHTRGAALSIRGAF